MVEMKAHFTYVIMSNITLAPTSTSTTCYAIRYRQDKHPLYILLVTRGNW